MTARRTGQVITKSGASYVRVRMGGKRRHLLRLSCDAGDVEARALRVATVVEKLVGAKRENVALHFARHVAAATTRDELRGIEQAVEALCSGRSKELARAVTVEQFGQRWVSGDLHRAHPQRVALKETADDDEMQLRRYINPVVGSVPLAAFTSDHAEEVMRRLPARLSSASYRHVAQVLRRLLTAR